MLLESLRNASEADVFVTLFSEVGDQLSQWRAYSPTGSGYAIGLAPRTLRQAHGNSDRLHLLRCLYQPSEHIAALERLIGLAEDYIDEHKVAQSDDPDRVYREAFKLFAIWLPMVAAVIKHSSFSEEREWRLIAPATFFDEQSVRVRPGMSTLVPFKRFVLGENDVAIAVDEIVVGPTPHPSLAVEAVAALCESTALRNTRVYSSRIPFRAW
ncbi:DUF2971 domain-containing protein [Pseudogemmatithrix spongiicola]|uniref:DUF2971 domain-containing protein n=1 Tax=Pseudogemmatithrix spongiicola TaxID=3062599 RepID=UPI003466E1BF